MKRLLIVAPFLPFPMSSGGHQAVYNGIAAAVPTAEVYLTYPEYRDQGDDRLLLAEAFNGKLHIIPYLNHQPIRGEKFLDFIYRTKLFIKKSIRGANYVSKEHTPYQDWIQQLFPKSDGFITFVNMLIREYHIDIVQCEMLENLALVLSIPNHLKRIFVHHELGFVRKAQHPVISKKQSMEGLANLEINKMVEINLLNRFDSIVTLSKTDAQKLFNVGVTSSIIPSFAIVNTSPETELVSDQYSTLSFIGPEWHPSNMDGLLWFLKNCWLHLKETDPSYHLNVIGNWSLETQSLISSTYNDIHFLGFVDDLRPVIKNTIMIVPIKIGSGIRMKILEACLLGAPVVSTSVGAEGLPLSSGKDCYIADTPESFIQSILELKDIRKRLSFIASAQRIILEQYSLDALTKNRQELYL